MAAIASAIALIISVALYAVRSANPAPWDSQGFMLAGLALLAIHVAVRSWRR